MLYGSKPITKRVAVKFLFINNTNDAVTGLPIKVESEKLVRAVVEGNGDARYNIYANDNARQIDKVIIVQEHELINDNKVRPDKIIFKNVKYKIERTKNIGNRRVLVDLVEIK